MAFVMIAGPQILSAIFLATSENWRRNSAAYIAGAALSITLIVTIAYAVGRGVSHVGASHDTLDIVVLVLLVAAALHTFLKRKESEPPKWMGKLQMASPRFSSGLGSCSWECSRRTFSPRGPPAPICRTTAIRGGTTFSSCCSPCCSWRCR